MKDQKITVKTFEKLGAALKMSSNPDTEEIVDTLADVLEVADTIEDAVKDGLQGDDIAAGIKAWNIGKEVFDDAKVFWAQFQALPPLEARSAVLEARAMFLARGNQFSPISEGIARFLYASASSYGYALNTVDIGKLQVELWKSFVDGGPMFPDETK